MAKNDGYIQQGDVIFVPITEDEFNNKMCSTACRGTAMWRGIKGEESFVNKIRNISGQYTIKEGEITGHAHKMEAIHAEAFRANWPFTNIILDVHKPSQVIHEEHKTITLSPGKYIVNSVKIHDYLPSSVDNIVHEAED